MEPAFPFETVQLAAVGELEVHEPDLSAPILRYCTKGKPKVRYPAKILNSA